MSYQYPAGSGYPASGYQDASFGYPPAPGGYPTVPGYPSAGYPPPPGPGVYPQPPPVYRQHYFIRSRMNGLVLDLEGASHNPGTPVIMWNKKTSDFDNQLWYDDPSTGTIRSKLTDMCLDVEGGTLVVKPLQYGDTNQQWERAGTVIRNRQNPNKVLDISDGRQDPGARLCSWDQHGGPNQSFDFEYVDGHPAQMAYPVGPAAYPTGVSYPPFPATSPAYPSFPAARREFFIVSQMNGKVVDIDGANPGSGACVIMYQRHPTPSKNQLWYIDQQGILRSALNDFTFSARENGHVLQMYPYTGDPHQQWYIDGNRIMNRVGDCLDIKGANSQDSAELITWKYQSSSNQHWNIEYVN